MSVSIQDFGKSTSGQTVKLATLKNDFIEVQLLSYAAIIHRIIVKDRKGNPVDVVLGYDTAADYELNTDSMGAAVGRFANRIAGAQFPLYEEIVHITPNQNGNCLHSGLHGFNHTMFDVALTPGETDSVTMTATSPAGTDGFPGNFDLTIQYSLAKSGLVIRYGATTDAPTVCNMTNHSYFNLNGHASGSALGHRVTVDADFYLEADAASIPTGRKLPVKGTPMDFTEEKTLGLGLEDRMKQPVGLLSGGQRQALTLLMATLVTPKLLLLDEHTAALDPGTADKVLELTKKIVAENHLTCLMITHNMHDALTLGNRTLMMDHGHIVLDISGEERAHTTVDGLLDRFAENVGHALDNDRILLSKEK